jgi:YesN/AraC family two-component response regulator
MSFRYVEHMGECFTLDQFKQLFAQLFSDAAAVIQANKEKQDSTVSLVMEMIENRYADDLSLDLLADRLNLSTAYLSVYIKEKTGVNFSDHLNAVRIRKAKELLTGTGLSVQEISARIGYRNVTSFNRMFKKITGIPPGEYRKNQWLKAE